MTDVAGRLDEIEAGVMSGLKDFQHATVERVAWLFAHGQNRVLVSDEVGLGKTLVARGVVAKTARLQKQAGDKLFKVVYVCSNAAIAQQNLCKLRLTCEQQTDSVGTSRLSMQHLSIFRQEHDPALLERYIQLIPLTPDTSFRLTGGSGAVQERALMYAILRRVPALMPCQAELETVMMGQASATWNDWCRDHYEQEVSSCDEASGGTYLPYMAKQASRALARPQEDGTTLLEQLQALCRSIRRNGTQPAGGAAVIGRLRVLFAQISLDKLQPDLVILDEFQRFRFLLTADPDSEAGMLAHRFFHTRGLRMLLLSATPYKMYSTLEEIEGEQEDIYYKEFLDVMKFLNEGREEDFLTVWNGYSVRLRELTRGDTAILQAKRAAEDAMYQTVCRTERWSAANGADLTDDSSIRRPVEVREADIRSYVQAQTLLEQIGAPFRVPADYVKSTPYLLSFMRDYQLKRYIERWFQRHPDKLRLLKKDTFWVDRKAIDRYEKLPCNNARLERVMELSLEKNAEKLLWVPPSRPYYPPGGPFKGAEGFTKTLIFSSWEMVPRMIASLVSYEAERKTVGAATKQERGENARYFLSREERRYPPPRMNFSLRPDGSPGAMALFCLLYPSRFLTACYDPLTGLSENLSLGELRRRLKADIGEKLSRYPAPREGRKDQQWYYLAPLLLDPPDYASAWLCNGEELDGEEEQGRKNTGFRLHLQALRELYRDARSVSAENLGARPDDLLDVLADLTLASPAVCLNRTYQRYRGAGDGDCAQLAGLGARAFLNRMNTTESTAVVELVCGKKSDEAHWRNLLTYCVQGNLQAVLDEYAHLIAGSLDAESPRLSVLHQQFLEGLALRTTPYDADTFEEFKRRALGEDRTGRNKTKLRSHFAAAFTKGDGKERDTDRKRKVRNAFNSPFRPFVLATTSIGQEGLDFHNYCRRIVHWNLPANPIDLEQREGRINRYECLAIRQNVALRYGSGPFRADLWQEMFDRAAQEERTPGSSDLIPYWALTERPDMIKIERIVPMYPFSRDGLSYERLMKILSLYRLTLGQARQEELLRYLFQQEDGETLQKLFINLSPYFREHRETAVPPEDGDTVNDAPPG